MGDAGLLEEQRDQLGHPGCPGLKHFGRRQEEVQGDRGDQACRQGHG